MPSKRHKQKGPMDMFFTPNPTYAVEATKDQGKQKIINELCGKELREKACRDIARWFYDAGVLLMGLHLIVLLVCVNLLVNMAQA